MITPNAIECRVVSFFLILDLNKLLCTFKHWFIFKWHTIMQWSTTSDIAQKIAAAATATTVAIIKRPLFKWNFPVNQINGDYESIHFLIRSRHYHNDTEIAVKKINFRVFVLTNHNKLSLDDANSVKCQFRIFIKNFKLLLAYYIVSI